MCLKSRSRNGIFYFIRDFLGVIFHLKSEFDFPSVQVWSLLLYVAKDNYIVTVMRAV